MRLVDVKVQLDDTLDGCYLTIFAYAGNTAFDPDASQNIRLWSGKVTNGNRTCNFSTANLPLKVGYKIVACLNVPVGTDNTGDTFYRSSVSQALEVVDGNGQGFKDYDPYPNVSIDETTLEEGATSLHISLIGDQRIFQAAKDGKTSIVCSVAQYPDGEDFDFESSDQISLASNIVTTEAFEGKEITLSEPLRAGYRVRAVVYWHQNPDIFLVKGNDYEAMFGQPDDSVLVTGSTQQNTPAAVINGEVFADAKSISVTVTGDIPDGSTLLLKSYDSSTTEFAMNEGTWVGSAFDLTADTYTVTPQTGSLAGDRKLVAFVQNSGTIVAQSAPVVIQTAKPFTITTTDDLTTESTQVIFQVTASDDSIDNINIAKLCKVKADGEADTSAPVATKSGQKPGDISFNITAGTLSAGDKVCLVLTYANGEAVYTSEPFTVTAPLPENSLAIQETEFTTKSTSATVAVSAATNSKADT